MGCTELKPGLGILSFGGLWEFWEQKRGVEVDMEAWKKKKYAATVRVKTVITNNLRELSESHEEKSRSLV